MKKEEKKRKLEEYEQKVRSLLGYHLWGYHCEFVGDRPTMKVIYYDYKVSIIVRAELQRILPEVELVQVERKLSKAAMLYALEPMLNTDDFTDECSAYIVSTQYDENDNEIASAREQTPIAEWVKSKLFDMDLSDVELRYLDKDMEELATGTLSLNASVSYYDEK